jgi:hypothetical protein
LTALAAAPARGGGVLDVVTSSTDLKPLAEAVGGERVKVQRLDAGLARRPAAMAPYRGARAVAYRDSWPYFARRFGPAIVASVEPVPGVPPSTPSLAALAASMKDAVPRLPRDDAGDRLVLRTPQARARARQRWWLGMLGARSPWCVDARRAREGS